MRYVKPVKDGTELVSVTHWQVPNHVSSEMKGPGVQLP